MPPIILSIAGSDCSGGAGIQADIKTISALGGYAASVITAVTAQNTLDVQAVHSLPADIVRAQIASVMDDLQPAAIKIGMVHNADIVHTIAECLQKYRPEFIVYDPVLISTSGRRRNYSCHQGRTLSSMHIDNPQSERSHPAERTEYHHHYRDGASRSRIIPPISYFHPHKRRTSIGKRNVRCAFQPFFPAKHSFVIELYIPYFSQDRKYKPARHRLYPFLCHRHLPGLWPQS